MQTRRVVVLPRFGGPDVMCWEDGPIPEPGDGELLIAVEAIGVNFADTMVRRGEYRRDQPLSFIPGFEVAGRVLRSAPGGPPEGAEVAAFLPDGGGYASVVCAQPRDVFALREGMGVTRGAGIFTQGVTAHYGVHRFGRVREGDVVLVHAAAGGLGSLAVQLAAAAGARVIGVASTEAKRAIATRHGASDVLGVEAGELTAAVRELTGGRGADVVLDGVGGELFAPSLRALAHGGRYVVLGSASQQPATFDARALMPRNQTVCGFVVARVGDEDPREPAATFDEVQRLVLDGTLRPEIATLDAADIASAHAQIESRALTGKLVALLSD